MYRRFGEVDAAGASPLYERVAVALSESGEALRAIEAAPARKRHPTVILAALHDLALAGRAPALAAAYAAADGDAAAGAAIDTLLRMTHSVVAIAVRRQPRSNETGRCTVLYPAIAEAARRVGANAVGLIDVGCSAGLNLNVDRVGITYSNGQSLGDPRPTVAVELADEERETLVRSWRRHSSSQWRCGRGSCWPARTAGRTPRSPTSSAVTGARSASGAVRRGGAGGLAGAPIWAASQPGAPGLDVVLFPGRGSWLPVHDAVENQVGDRLARYGQAFTDHLHTGRRGAHHAAAGPPCPAISSGPGRGAGTAVIAPDLTTPPCLAAPPGQRPVYPFSFPSAAAWRLSLISSGVCQALDHAAGVSSAAPAPGLSSNDGALMAPGQQRCSTVVVTTAGRTAVPGCRTGAWGSRGMRESRGSGRLPTGCRGGRRHGRSFTERSRLLIQPRQPRPNDPRSPAMPQVRA